MLIEHLLWDCVLAHLILTDSTTDVLIFPLCRRGNKDGSGNEPHVRMPGNGSEPSCLGAPALGLSCWTLGKARDKVRKTPSTQGKGRRADQGTGARRRGGLSVLGPAGGCVIWMQVACNPLLKGSRQLCRNLPRRLFTRSHRPEPSPHHSNVLPCCLVCWLPE